jgi:hypothetical protein
MYIVESIREVLGWDRIHKGPLSVGPQMLMPSEAVPDPSGHVATPPDDGPCCSADGSRSSRDGQSGCNCLDKVRFYYQWHKRCIYLSALTEGRPSGPAAATDAGSSPLRRCSDRRTAGDREGDREDCHRHAVPGQRGWLRLRRRRDGRRGGRGRTQPLPAVQDRDLHVPVAHRAVAGRAVRGWPVGHGAFFLWACSEIVVKKNFRQCNMQHFTCIGVHTRDVPANLRGERMHGEDLFGAAGAAAGANGC